MTAQVAPQNSREKQYADDLPEALRSETITARVIRDYIWRPVNRENNWSAFCMVGREGSGKSFTTASILEKADPTFNADRVFFDPQEMMQFMADLDKEERAGKAMMIDEAGVGMGVRSWYDDDQIKVNKAAQTMRDDNMILATTLPSFGLMDSQLRTRHHGFCEMWDVQPGEHAVWSWKNIVVNREEGGDSIKRKEFPRYHYKGRRQRVRRLKCGPPSDEFIEAYEAQKEEFKQDYYEEVADSGEEAEDVGAKDVVAEVVTDDRFEEFVSVHGSTGNEYIDKDKIYMEYSDRGLTHRGARAAKKAIEDEWRDDS